ncbi:hypothetical protein AC1031_008716 [Aphanomyces cochlioides]|nr:hypothetical protein AC1031_008716 [Aphanomyces cochlioides]
MELEALEDGDRCGSTAVVFAAAGSRVCIANVGDSHCLHISDTTCSRVTQDHHVRICDEVNRIKAKRGIIVNQRVSGVSKVTRAFGQNDEKDFIISSPAITTLEVNDDAVFVLCLGCVERRRDCIDRAARTECRMDASFDLPKPH